jgi:non-specific serine/threonine protein kinase
MPSKFLSLLAQAMPKNKSTAAVTLQSTANGSTSIFGVGTLIDGRYRLDAEIGRGAMGIVYLARDIPNDQDVAIKVLNLDTSNNLTRQQFLQEAETVSGFHHPHIVSVHETGMIDIGGPELLPFIAMEFVQGTSLNELRALTYSTIIDIGKQICEALEHIHNLGFVYRDLKPGNILIEKRGLHYFVKLIDFNLVRPRGMAYRATESSIAGSFFFLAPELITGQLADVASDLYALGITFYEMITGRLPFSDFDEHTLLLQHLEAAVTPPSQSRADVPPALETIVLRLLEKNPKDRFASAEEVHSVLEQVPQQSGSAQGNLPSEIEDFIKQENAITTVTQLLESDPLVTILGDGESLALAIGTQLADLFSDGMWWVELDSVNDPNQVVETILSVLGVRPDPQRSLAMSLIEYLREKDLLLVLSHCDRVLSACAQLAEMIVRTCPRVRTLATSHQPLNTSTEKCYRIVP